MPRTRVARPTDVVSLSNADDLLLEPEMKATVTLRWKTFGFLLMIAVGAILAIMPSRLAGASLEARLAEVASQMPARGYTVAPATLAEWLSSGKPVVLVDIREHWEFDEFHIAGAEKTTLADLVSPAAIKALPADRPIVVVGRADGASDQAAAILRLAGRDAYSLDGGLAAWWREVLTPASLDATVPPDERPSAAARRVAWRSRFLGSAGAPTSTGGGGALTRSGGGAGVPTGSGTAPAARPATPPAAPAPSTPAPAGATPPKAGATRGKGC
jgi:rhodanese-related sulfurtransferase